MNISETSLFGPQVSTLHYTSYEFRHNSRPTRTLGHIACRLFHGMSSPVPTERTLNRAFSATKAGARRSRRRRLRRLIPPYSAALRRPPPLATAIFQAQSVNTAPYNIVFGRQLSDTEGSGSLHWPLMALIRREPPPSALCLPGKRNRPSNLLGATMRCRPADSGSGD